MRGQDREHWQGQPAAGESREWKNGGGKDAVRWWYVGGNTTRQDTNKNAHGNWEGLWFDSLGSLMTGP